MSPQKDLKEAMKQARAQRAAFIKAAAAAAKEQKEQVGQIKEQLSQAPGTPAEIARATGLPASRVMWLLAALRKYNQVIEADKKGDYFSYQLAPAPEAVENHN